MKYTQKDRRLGNPNHPNGTACLPRNRPGMARIPYVAEGIKAEDIAQNARLNLTNAQKKELRIWQAKTDFIDGKGEGAHFEGPDIMQERMQRGERITEQQFVMGDFRDALLYCGERAIAAVVTDPSVIWHLLAHGTITESSAQELLMDKLALAVADGKLGKYWVDSLVATGRIHCSGAMLLDSGSWPVEKLRRHVNSMVELYERIYAASMVFARSEWKEKIFPGIVLSKDAANRVPVLEMPKPIEEKVIRELPMPRIFETVQGVDSIPRKSKFVAEELEPLREEARMLELDRRADY